jgi:hypothetical protein
MKFNVILALVYISFSFSLSSVVLEDKNEKCISYHDTETNIMATKFFNGGFSATKFVENKDDIDKIKLPNPQDLFEQLQKRNQLEKNQDNLSK